MVDRNNSTVYFGCNQSIFKWEKHKRFCQWIFFLSTRSKKTTLVKGTTPIFYRSKPSPFLNTNTIQMLFPRWENLLTVCFCITENLFSMKRPKIYLTLKPLLFCVRSFSSTLITCTSCDSVVFCDAMTEKPKTFSLWTMYLFLRLFFYSNDYIHGLVFIHIRLENLIMASRDHTALNRTFLFMTAQESGINLCRLSSKVCRKTKCKCDII